MRRGLTLESPEALKRRGHRPFTAHLRCLENVSYLRIGSKGKYR